MVSRRSKQAFKTWLAARPKSWSKQIEVVAMDGFAGFKTAAAEVSHVGYGVGDVTGRVADNRDDQSDLRAQREPG